MKNIYLLVGRSGSGKSSIAKKLEDYWGYKTLKSYTTREKRSENDNDHLFVSEDIFKEIPQSEIVAQTYFDGNYYFATKDLVQASDIYIIDIDGLVELKRRYDGTKGIKTIYIDTSELIAQLRMELRGDSTDKITQRLLHDKKAFPDKLTEKYKFDLVVDNDTDDIDNTVSRIQRFIAFNEQITPVYAKIIYLSHPYSNKITNKTKLENFQKYLMKEYPDYLFISPIHAFGHLYDSLPYEAGLNCCLSLLFMCDEVWMCGDWTNSRGCQHEVQVAINESVPVKFFSLQEYEEVVALD